MRNRYTALFAAVFALSMITGCGGSESADKGTTASAQPSAEQSKGSGLRGEAAPTFKLKDLAGADVAVEAKGKPYIINFWATWCPPCQAEIPDLAAFHAAHKDTVDFYAVNLQEDAQPVQKFMAERKVELPVVLDTQGAAANLYGVRAIPTTVVVDRDGKIAYRKTGGVTKEELEDVISKL
ncbi:MAG: TlpA family protein disulfide reductase [Centipeda sp. (in: firmicutes)]|uniref:TlpA family protein disulfide reductase n=1 Tax=Selenomonas sp. oral taxon 920 TaxID=1884263 RepID=UPI000840E404|nr:TlpA disulfide reductase family protein [Selenomonas sp. oral taxon 920]AOH48427.1 cytochrome C biogenesis protein [Selenomonas sp. oral taxon 920]